MDSADIIEVARDAIFTLLTIATPIMLVALLVGLVIALFQALTQIQEMTLTFIPKILAIFISLLIMLPFMGSTLASFMERLATRIIGG